MTDKKKVPDPKKSAEALIDRFDDQWDTTIMALIVLEKWSTMCRHFDNNDTTVRKGDLLSNSELLASCVSDFYEGAIDSAEPELLSKLGDPTKTEIELARIAIHTLNKMCVILVHRGQPAHLVLEAEQERVVEEIAKEAREVHNGRSF